MSGGSFGIKTPKNIYSPDYLKNKDLISKVLENYDDVDFSDTTIIGVNEKKEQVSLETESGQFIDITEDSYYTYNASEHDSSLKFNKKKTTKSSDNIVNSPGVDTKVWSVFYGQSAKHTKDFLGDYFGRAARNFGGLSLDRHSRKIAYDKNGNIYESGVLVKKATIDENGKIKYENVDPEDPNYYGKKSVAAKVRDGVSDWIERKTSYDDIASNRKNGSYFVDAQYKIRDISKGAYIMDETGAKTSFSADELSKFRTGTVSSSGGLTTTYTDENGKKVTFEPYFDEKERKVKFYARTSNGIDQFLTSKFGGMVDSVNKKLGNTQKTTIGSDNQYRVGQNWRYGSVGLYNNSKVVEGSLLGVDFSASGKYGSVSGRADFLYGKATANFEIGPDHIELSASAEASLLHAEIKGQTAALEDDNGYLRLAANGSVSADVAKVYANGKIGAGYYKGADGKMHLDAGIQGSVGADLCSATAKGNVDLGPIGVGGQATVKIGIGAQANLGFEDGKFNLHLGLAFGVGVELGVSIDLSRATKAVVDFGKAAYSKGKEIVNDIGTAAKKTYNNIKSGAKKVISWLNPFD